MANRDITSALTGLTQGINQYLGMKLQYDAQSQQNVQKAGLELSNKLTEQSNQAQLDLAKNSALKAYELTLAGKIDPDTASQMFPEAAKWVTGFSEKNGRNPTMDEFKSGVDLMSKPNKDEQKELNRENRINTTILEYSNKLENNYLIKKLNEQNVSLGQLVEISELAKAGNTVASSAMGVKMARAMGEVGVLTESDITRYVQSGQLTRGAADKLKRWIKGRPTDATIDEINQIGAVLSDTASRKIQPIYDRYVNRLSENMGLSKEEAAKRLDVPYSGQVKGKKEIKPTENDPLGLGI